MLKDKVEFRKEIFIHEEILTRALRLEEPSLMKCYFLKSYFLKLILLALLCFLGVFYLFNFISLIVLSYLFFFFKNFILALLGILGTFDLYLYVPVK